MGFVRSRDVLPRAATPRAALLMGILPGIVAIMAHSNVSADDELAAVMDNLHQNEALYEDIEIVWRSSFTFGEIKRVTDQHLRSRERNGRYVRQDGMYYIDHETDQASEVVAVHRGLLQAYDGEMTRILEERGGHIGNVVKEFQDTRYKVLPHALPLRRKHVKVPLSIWLQGREAIRAHLNGEIDKTTELYDQTLSYLGLETVDDLECAVVSVAYYRRGGDPEKLISRRHFWLAVDRNYLPIQTKHFSLGLSDELPMTKTSLQDLRELAPGVWFPFVSTIAVYDRGSLRDDGKYVVGSSEELVVEKAMLDPQYDISFFRDIQFPDGTPVYEIEQEEIVKSYVQGGGPPVDAAGYPQPAGGISSTMWLGIANAILIAAAIIVYLWMRARHRR